MAFESTARNVTERVDALAAALREAGVTPEQSAALLASAATAAMNAVLLDALLEDTETQAPVAELEPAAEPIRLAA